MQRNIINGHTTIAFAMDELNYKPNPNGRCAGIVETGIDKFLTGDLENLNETIIQIFALTEKICLINKLLENNPANIDAIQNKQIFMTQLRNPNYLELFDSIQTYQDPEDYTEVAVEHL